MRELKELSANYAKEKTDEMISQIVAQAFADGYHMGYKDREEEIPVDLRDGKTEFVDLGLPSGTLWSFDFEKNNKELIYAPYESATILEIPTLEQCAELFSSCEFSNKDGLIYCIGPKANMLFLLLRDTKKS